MDDDHLIWAQWSFTKIISILHKAKRIEPFKNLIH